MLTFSMHPEFFNEDELLKEILTFNTRTFNDFKSRAIDAYFTGKKSKLVRFEEAFSDAFLEKTYKLFEDDDFRNNLFYNLIKLSGDIENFYIKSIVFFMYGAAFRYILSNKNVEMYKDAFAISANIIFKEIASTYSTVPTTFKNVISSYKVLLDTIDAFNKFNLELNKTIVISKVSFVLNNDDFKSLPEKTKRKVETKLLSFFKSCRFDKYNNDPLDAFKGSSVSELEISRVHNYIKSSTKNRNRFFKDIFWYQGKRIQTKIIKYIGETEFQKCLCGYLNSAFKYSEPSKFIEIANKIETYHDITIDENLLDEKFQSLILAARI